MSGDLGADFVVGLDGNDTVSGGAGDDPHVNGNEGRDVVHGDAGADTVYGGRGDDQVYGDAGDDLLSGDLGSDTLYGGAGADVFVLRPQGGADWVADFSAAEGDKVRITSAATYTVSSLDGQVVIELGGGDQLGLAGVSFATFNASWIEIG